MLKKAQLEEKTIKEETEEELLNYIEEHGGL